jgi:spermidine synthase
MTERLLPNLRGFVRLLADGEDRPRVDEHAGIRCLRFNDGVVQSSMRVDDPCALDLGYTRAMMGFLLFNSTPAHILMVGLGGGSLQKFCHRALPLARLTTLEIDPAVIALRDRFLIPADSERFQVILADAGAWLANDNNDNTRADVILVDGYSAHGLPENLCSPAFYDDCRHALSARGVLVCNLWGDAPARAAYIERLKTTFDGRVWWSRARDSHGLIVFAVNDANFYPRWAQLLSQARTLDGRYRLDLAAVVSDLRNRPDPDG